MFSERLSAYRNSNKMNRRCFAEKLNISEGYYSMIESGKRKASNNFIQKLVNESGLSEVYWIYGIDESKKDSLEFRQVRRALEQIIDFNLIKDTDKLFEGCYTEGTIEELVITSLKRDIESLIKQKNK